MNIKKAFSVYFSPTGTTEKAVLAFTSGTGIPRYKFDLTNAQARKTFTRSFSQNELVVIGLPVYGGRLPKNLEDFFSVLKGNQTPAVALVMYGNRGYDDALIELKLRLEERGFDVKAGVTFIGEHTFSSNIATGRPDKHDLEIAENFGRQAALTISNNISGILTLKGNYPFVSKGADFSNPRSPSTYANVVTLDTCLRCGLCAENCPWGAIDMDDFQTINPGKCLRCFRCVKNCPTGAKLVKNEKFFAVMPEFETRLNSQRYEPELFLPQGEPIISS